MSDFYLQHQKRFIMEAQDELKTSLQKVCKLESTFLSRLESRQGRKSRLNNSILLVKE